MPQNSNGHDPEERLDVFLKEISPPPTAQPLVQGDMARVGRLLGGLFEALGPLLEASIFCVDRCERRIIYTSQHLLASMGYEPWEIQSIAFADLERLVHPRDRQRVARFEASLSSDSPVDFAANEVRLRTAAGRWRWIEILERVMTRAPDGRAHLTIGVARDVTERRKLRRALSATSKELLESEENERRRIARDLHDSTGQLLAAASLMLSEAEARAGTEARSPIRRARNAIGSAQKDIRTLSYLLHPPQLASEGLPATLASLAEGFGRRSGLVVRLEIDGEPDRLGSAAELALFRVAQEALMNVHKHAQARVATMRLRYGESAVELEVEDDGVGLEASAADLLTALRPGVGLSSMRARMAQLGGRLTLSRRGKGLHVSAILPMVRRA
jgi:PAS domain S-box-containing protein